jgi:hypothetical protein
MSAMSRRKGVKAEREIVNRHKAEGVHAERVPLSGQVKGARIGDGHDVDVYARGKDAAPLCGEVKIGGNVPKFIETALGENDFAVMRRSRGQWVYILPERTWFELVKALQEKRIQISCKPTIESKRRAA